jgi:hypothetical protein
MKPGAFRLKNQNLLVKGSQIKYADQVAQSQSAKNYKSFKFNVIGSKPKMVKAMKSIVLKDILSPKSCDSNPYY